MSSVWVPIFQFLSFVFLLFLSASSSSSPPLPSSYPLRCFSCTTLNADRLVAEVRDPGWRAWLQQIRMVPRTSYCGDLFRTVTALRHGVLSEPCADGVCAKLWFRDRRNSADKGSGNGSEGVWRSCVRNGEGMLREDCTRIRSSQGEMEVCTCEGNLCNGAHGKERTTTVFACPLLFVPIFLYKIWQFLAF